MLIKTRFCFWIRHLFLIQFMMWFDRCVYKNAVAPDMPVTLFGLSSSSAQHPSILPRGFVCRWISYRWWWTVSDQKSDHEPRWWTNCQSRSWNGCCGDLTHIHMHIHIDRYIVLDLDITDITVHNRGDLWHILTTTCSTAQGSHLAPMDKFSPSSAEANFRMPVWAANVEPALKRFHQGG